MKESKCPWCGRDIYWIEADGRKVAIEAGYTGYKREPEKHTLYTQGGAPIRCTILWGAKEGVDGWGHVVHLCPKRPRYRRPRPMSRAEKWRAMRDE